MIKVKTVEQALSAITDHEVLENEEALELADSNSQLRGRISSVATELYNLLEEVQEEWETHMEEESDDSSDE